MRPPRSALTRAFLTLAALSLATTGLTRLVPAAGPAFVAAVLGLAAWKARLILTEYLGLAATRPWRRGFTAVVGLFVLLAYGLYLVPPPG